MDDARFPLTDQHPVRTHERSALPTSAAAHAPPPPYPSTHVPRACIAIRLVTLPMPAAPLSPTPPFALCSAEAATRHSPILKVRGASHASHSSRLASHYSQPRHERRVNRVQVRWVRLDRTNSSYPRTGHKAHGEVSITSARPLALIQPPGPANLCASLHRPSPPARPGARTGPLPSQLAPAPRPKAATILCASSPTSPSPCRGCMPRRLSP